MSEKPAKGNTLSQSKKKKGEETITEEENNVDLGSISGGLLHWKYSVPR